MTSKTVNGRLSADPPHLGATAMCPACEVVLAPERRVSDDTWRFPEHPSPIYALCAPDGTMAARDGRRVTPPPGYTCCESKTVTAADDYRRAEQAMTALMALLAQWVPARTRSAVAA